VERIEVLKVSGSSLYGNNAMGGVINIITKTPDKPQEVHGSVSYGTYNTIREDLAIRIRSEKGFYGSLAQNYTTSDATSVRLKISGHPTTSNGFTKGSTCRQEPNTTRSSTLDLVRTALSQFWSSPRHFLFSKTSFPPLFSF
jgi:outer membrane receptor protein involved in Fe transport